MQHEFRYVYNNKIALRLLRHPPHAIHIDQDLYQSSFSGNIHFLYQVSIYHSVFFITVPLLESHDRLLEGIIEAATAVIASEVTANLKSFFKDHHCGIIASFLQRSLKGGDHGPATTLG